MGKGAKIILIVIATLLVCCGGLALFVVLQPDAEPEQADAAATAEPAPLEPALVPVVEATVDPAGEETPVPEEPLPDGIYNILFIGADSRTAEETEAEGLSDSMMCVSYNTNTNVVTLISFMRDSIVSRIGVNSQFPGKLNAAYKNGGPVELMETLNLNFDLDIKNYVTVGYEGFSMLVDELGGVDVEITGEEAYYINWRSADIRQDNIYGQQHFRLQELQSLGRPILEEDYEGVKLQHLDGRQSLWYARNRTTPAADGTPGSDGLRINRQQVLMQLIYQKVKNEKTLDTAIALIKFAFQYVKTDMDILTMTKLGTRVLKADHIEFVNVRVPFEGSSRSGNAEKEEIVSGLYFDLDATAVKLHEIIYGTTAP